jgi:hypothetical protein
MVPLGGQTALAHAQPAARHAKHARPPRLPPSFAAQVWSFERSAESRDTEGGTSKRSVLEQVAKLRKFLAEAE